MQRVATLLALAAAACGCQELGSSLLEGTTFTYLSEPEALRAVFPDAAWVVEEKATPDAAEREQIAALLGSRQLESSFAVRGGLRADGTLDGFAVIHAEIGKFKPFDFIVGIEPDGTVRRVAVMTYRESRGGEVAGRRFLVQYPGKKATDPLSIHRDIINISGATMSVNALNHGVKKALAVVDAVYRRHPERLARLLAGRRHAIGGASVREEPPLEPRGDAAALVEVSEARYLMGALCEIRAFGADRPRLRAALASAFAAMEAADRALSDWRDDSELSRLSREAAEHPVTVSPLTAELLELASRIAGESGGAFDITVGPLVRAWGLRGGSTASPSAAALESLRPHMGAGRVRLERLPGGGGVVRLDAPGMRLDPGSIGKGFAVDLAVRELRAAGVGRALVDFSGNMYALGAPPGRTAWTVAVRDAARPGAVVGLVELRDQGISSSGNYEKHVVLDGRRVGHLLSPFTLRPVDRVLGATVIAPSAALADGYSTAACVLGEAAIGFLEARPEVEGLVVLGEDPTATPAQRLATRGWRCGS